MQLMVLIQIQHKNNGEFAFSFLNKLFISELL